MIYQVTEINKKAPAKIVGAFNMENMDMNLGKIREMLTSNDKELLALGEKFVDENKAAIYNDLEKWLSKEEWDNCKYYYSKTKGNPEKRWPKFYADFIKRIK